MSELHPPVIGVRRTIRADGSHCFRFFCGFCRRVHEHEAREGYTVAGCSRASPFYSVGYVLQEIHEDLPNVATVL